MKYIIYILIAIYPAFSQEVEIKMNFKLGQQYKYLVNVENFQKIGDNTSTSKSQFKITQKLIEDNTDGLLFSWKLFDYVIPEAIKGISKEYEKLNEGVEIRFYTTQNGIYKTIENWDEILNFYTNKLKKLEEDFWGDEKTKSQIKSIEKNLLTPEKLSEYLLGEIIAYHNFYGGALKLNKEETNSLEIDDQYLNIKLPVINTSKLSKLGEDFKLEVNEHIDQIKSSKIINNLVKKEKLDKLYYSNIQKFNYLYDKNFIVKEMNYDKVVEINNQKMTKKIKFKRIN